MTKTNSSIQHPQALLNHELALHLTTALQACDGAQAILNSHFGNLRNVDEKFQAGLVSDADRESEIFIKEKIRAVFPTHAILGEESGLTGSAPDKSKGSATGALWMIDPLDGTTNYIHQFPFFNISIGLELNGELVLGVVDAPKLGLRYMALKGSGAYVNGDRIHCSQRTNFRDGLFATGFSGSDPELPNNIKIAAEFIRNTRGIRRAGAAALDLCFVAQGSFDAFWERKLSPWDMAAGAVIVEEAGGRVTSMNGTAFDSRGSSILAGSRHLHSAALQVIQRCT